MSGSSEILQEYLVAVGFQTDAVSVHKFEEGLSGVTKKIFQTGTKVAEVIAGVEAATAAFAYNMRKVYFEAELSGSAVSKLKSLEFAGKQIGISAEAMGSAIHSMATELRLNPGKMGLLDSLTGLREEGKDTTDQLLDLIKATEKFPEYIGAKYAEQFGINADIYHQMRDHLAQLVAEQHKAENVFRAYGVHFADYKKETLAYAESLDTLKLKFEAVVTVMLAKFEPAFEHLTDMIGKIMQLTSAKEGAGLIAKGDWWDASFVLSAGDLGKAAVWKAQGLSDAEIAQRLTHQAPQAATPAGRAHGTGFLAPGDGPIKSPAGPQSGAAGKQSYMHSLEKAFGLPHGMLNDMWSRESSKGRRLLSPKGAMGPFQFMPDTAEEYGLTNPYSFHASAAAAARKMHHLMSLYHGDKSKALAAYNWGEGHLNNDIRLHGDNWLAYAPQETQGYVRFMNRKLGTSGAGSPNVQLTQHTEIRVTSSANPAEVARGVAGQQGRVNGDLVRNLKGHLS